MQRIKGLDGIRAIAALLVVLGHADWTQQVMGEGYGKFVFETVLSPLRGVHIFFALSGFLISQILQRELQRTSTIDLQRFARRRALRLLPAYLAYLIVVALLGWAGVLDFSPVAYLAALTYTYNYLPATLGHRFLTHLWSLAVEAQFYVLLPMLMLWLSKRKLIVTLGALGLLFIVVTPIIYNLPLPDYPVSRQGQRVNLGDFTVQDIWRASHFFIPAAATCFVGCIAGLRTTKVCELFQRPSHIGLLGALLFVHPVLIYFHYEWYSLTVQMIGVGLCLIYLQHRQLDLAVTVLDAAPLRFLGKISYGTYLWQGLFIGTGAASILYWWQGLWWGVLFSYLAAVASYYLIELPFLRRKNHSRG